MFKKGISKRNQKGFVSKRKKKNTLWTGLRLVQRASRNSLLVTQHTLLETMTTWHPERMIANIFRVLCLMQPPFSPHDDQDRYCLRNTLTSWKFWSNLATSLVLGKLKSASTTKTRCVGMCVRQRYGYSDVGTFRPVSQLVTSERLICVQVRIFCQALDQKQSQWVWVDLKEVTNFLALAQMLSWKGNTGIHAGSPSRGG